VRGRWGRRWSRQNRKCHPLPGLRGRKGGIAISSVGKDAFNIPEVGTNDGGGGEGGCDPLSSAEERCGSGGIGGLGGLYNGHFAQWLNVNITNWTGGSGGSSEARGGGGGYGGGAAGFSGVSDTSILSAEGGGGGGSFASASTVSNSHAPVAGSSNAPDPAKGGAIRITFDICAYDSSLEVCLGGEGSEEGDDTSHGTFDKLSLWALIPGFLLLFV